MMKKIVLILLLHISYIAFGQDSIRDYTQLNELALVDTNGKVRMEAEKPAVFPLGADTLRNLIAKNFRLRKVITNADKEFCNLIFIIDKDGLIEQVKGVGSNITFNQEAERAFLKIKQKWIPGEMNGEKVRCRFRVPLTMTVK